MYYVDNFKDFWSLFLVVVFGFMISILKNLKKTKIGHYTKFLTNLWFWVMHELWKLSMCPQRILQKLNDFFFCTWQKTIWRLFRKKFRIVLYYNSLQYNFHIRGLDFEFYGHQLGKKRFRIFFSFFASGIILDRWWLHYWF